MTIKPQSTTTKLEPTLEPCPWCKAVPVKTDLAPSQRYRLDHKPACYLFGRMTDMRGSAHYIFIGLKEVEKWNTRVSANGVPTVNVEAIRHLAAERVANAARAFCEEIQEDAEGVPSLQLAELNEALDAWEACPDARALYDDSQPVLAALASLIEDQHATDHQRRVARLALTAINGRNRNELTEPERNQIRRAIAESDIAGCALENSDIDALVDLFDSWLERRTAASTVAPQQSEPQYLTINGQRRMVIPCPDGIPGCEVLHTAPAPSAAIQDVPQQSDDWKVDARIDRSFIAGMKFGWNCRDAENYKLFMETIRARNAEIYAASAVARSESSYSEGVAARVAPSRTALDEIEVALISIADGVSPQEAVGKAFNIINHERSKLNAAASSERCLSEGED